MSVFRTELKFIVDGNAARMLEDWAREETRPDPNSIDLTGEGYRISTLYFDTDHFDLYLRRRSHGRAEFRIRRYNGGPDVFSRAEVTIE